MISAATVAELHFGVLVTVDPVVRAARLRRLTTLARTFDALPVDDAVATSYGQLAAAVMAAGPTAPTPGDGSPDRRHGARSLSAALHP